MVTVISLGLKIICAISTHIINATIACSISHTAIGKVMKWLEDHDRRVLEWPDNFPPDLNPLENYWNPVELKRLQHIICPTTNG